MPTVSRWFVRGALLYLLLGLMMQGAQAAGLWPGTQITSLHALWAGWLTHLAAGVALWMLPQPKSKSKSKSKSKRLERLAWLAFCAMHLGLLTRLSAEPWALSSLSSSALKLSALSQLIGAWALTLSLWPRLTPKPKP